MTSLEFFKLMEKMGLTPDSTDAQTALDFSDAKKFCVTEDCTPADRADIYSENGKHFIVFDGKAAEVNRETLESLLNNGSVKKRVYD